MTILLVAFVSGAAASAAIWQLTKGIFGHPALLRRNVRGLDVPTAGGIVIVLAMLVVTVTGQLIWGFTDAQWAWKLYVAGAILPFVVLFAFLGLIDDLLASGDERGFRGHVGAMAHGRLTTGGLKLVGGGLVAVFAAFNPEDPWRSALDVLVIALAANTANLLDRAPGRVTKTAMILLAVVLGVNGIPEGLAFLTLVVGATFGLLVVELEEHVMLGDTGVNPVGAVFGFAVVQEGGTWVTAAVLVLLVALNVASERVSFSAVIARNPLLRWYDELGRHPT